MQPLDDLDLDALDLGEAELLAGLDVEDSAALALGAIDDAEGVWFEYVTQADDAVRPNHRALHGTVWRVGDPAAPVPPIDYGCRCGMRYVAAPGSNAAKVLPVAKVAPKTHAEVLADFLARELKTPAATLETVVRNVENIPLPDRLGKVTLQIQKVLTGIGRPGTLTEARPLARMLLSVKQPRADRTDPGPGGVTPPPPVAPPPVAPPPVAPPPVAPPPVAPPPVAPVAPQRAPRQRKAQTPEEKAAASLARAAARDEATLARADARNAGIGSPVYYADEVKAAERVAARAAAKAAAGLDDAQVIYDKARDARTRAIDLGREVERVEAEELNARVAGETLDEAQARGATPDELVAILTKASLASDAGDSPRLAALRAQHRAARDEETRLYREARTRARTAIVDATPSPIAATLPKDRNGRPIVPLGRGSSRVGAGAVATSADLPADGQDGVEFMVRAVSTRTGWKPDEVRVRVDPAVTRAHAIGDSVAMGAYDDARVYVHELAHTLENKNRHVQAEAAALLVRRTAGKPLEVIPGTPRELYRPGGFIDAYVTRDYAAEGRAGLRNATPAEVAARTTPAALATLDAQIGAARYTTMGTDFYGRPTTGGISELTGMGVEEMFNDPRRFRLLDREHFDATLAALYGARPAGGRVPGNTPTKPTKRARKGTP